MFDWSEHLEYFYTNPSPVAPAPVVRCKLTEQVWWTDRIIQMPFCNEYTVTSSYSLGFLTKPWTVYLDSFYADHMTGGKTWMNTSHFWLESSDSRPTQSIMGCALLSSYNMSGFNKFDFSIITVIPLNSMVPRLLVETTSFDVFLL